MSIKQKNRVRREKIMKGLRNTGIIIVCVGVFFGASYVVWNKAINDHTPLEYTDVYTIHNRDLFTYLSCEGEVQSSEKNYVVSNCTQRISRIFYNKGDFVNEGDLILKFDTSEYDKELDDLKKTKESLESLNITNQDYYKDTLSSQTDLKEMQLKKMQEVINITSALYDSVVEKNVKYSELAEEQRTKISDFTIRMKLEADPEKSELLHDQLENMQTLYGVYSEIASKYKENEAEYSDLLTQCKENYKILEQSYADSVLSAEDKYNAALLPDIQLGQLKDSISDLEKKISDCEVRAKSSGYLTDIYVSESELCSDGYIAKIENKTSNVIELKVKNDQINDIYEGMNALLSINSSLDRVYKGKVTSVPNYSATDFFNVKVTLEDDVQLSRGIGVSARLITAELSEQLCVPFDAVVKEEDGSYVFDVSKTDKGYRLNKKKVDILMETGYYFAVDNDTLLDGSIVCSDAASHTENEIINLKGDK